MRKSATFNEPEIEILKIALDRIHEQLGRYPDQKAGLTFKQLKCFFKLSGKVNSWAVSYEKNSC